MSREKKTGPTCIVGIGASAGGLEALDRFFDVMPADSGMAFVVIQHLSPDYKSLMAELLAKHTRMAVHKASEGMEVAPNSVYIIPPRKTLRLFHGRLLLSDQDRDRGNINLPIDVFLASLAEDQGERSVGIILSGTGSDGARGIRALKEAGGMVIAQDAETARFDGMPKAAVATGLTDFVLPVEEMPERLIAFAQHPYVADPTRRSPLIVGEDNFSRIFALLREQTRVDFTFYKSSTVIRRIERRMNVNQIHHLPDYVELMTNRPSEVTALYRDLLIGVTSFFRDPQVWEELARTHLARILANRTSPEVRMWVAGCSTGEEAYTLAMLCRDWMEKNGEKLEVKIFATDVDRDAIARAGAGLYPESAGADLGARNVTKYFNRQGDKLQIIRAVREMVVFAQHNLITDPPFTSLDFISCRNLLIYLQPSLQLKAIEAFNFAVKPGGLLLLGTSETTGDLSHAFDALDSKHKIFQSKGRARHTLRGDMGRLGVGWRPGERPRRSGLAAAAAREEERVIDRILTTLAGQYVPPALVVNERLELLHVLGDTGDFLKLPSGQVRNDISRMVVEELSVPLATGLRKVFRTGEELRYTNIRVRGAASGGLLNLTIRPLAGRKGQEALVIIFLEAAEPRVTDTAERPADFDVDAATEQRIVDLEQELQFNRENLQATIEELETSNEELQATNEELLASNEELQSTNEELQSVNEELHTVNSQYQSKIMELIQLNNDFDHLLSSAHIATLFLDKKLRVRKYTSAASEVFRLIDSDIGRPFEHLNHRLLDIDLQAIIADVLAGSGPREVEAVDDAGNWYLMRVLPYVLGGDIVEGVVITLVSITRLAQTRRELMTTESRFFHLFDVLRQGVLYLDLDGRIADANAAARVFLSAEERGDGSLDFRNLEWLQQEPSGRISPLGEPIGADTLRTGQPVFDRPLGLRRPGHDDVQWFRVITEPLHEGGNDALSGVVVRFIPDANAAAASAGEGES